MRSIGMDVQATFAQIAVVEDGLCRDECQYRCAPGGPQSVGGETSAQRPGGFGGDERGVGKERGLPA